MALLPLVFIMPASSHAADIEAAAGIWPQEPAGNLSYLGDTLDMRRDLNYTHEDRFTARLKVHLPAMLPNMYFMATFVKFQGENALPHPFAFGGAAFAAGTPFSSETQLNHYDITPYYSLIPWPARRIFNVDAGVNARVIEYRTSVTQNNASVTESSTIVVPLLYVGARFRASSRLSIEGEARGLVFGSEHYLDLLGRVKLVPVRPVFIAVGYRYDSMRIDRHESNLDTEFTGPFVEAGIDL
ncbi:MAG: TIGR04219 family outer membrane beta-barrel protein [Nitrospiraceae bacterium]|nr:TIGR04219 family outer membrane beta-barrel protein [Nitrospiraceae bacterium]